MAKCAFVSTVKDLPTTNIPDEGDEAGWHGCVSEGNLLCMSQLSIPEPEETRCRHILGGLAGKWRLPCLGSSRLEGLVAVWGLGGRVGGPCAVLVEAMHHNYSGPATKIIRCFWFQVRQFSVK